MRWATVSPMLSSAPQHSSIPCALTMRHVSARSSHVCVVTMVGEVGLCRLDVVVVAVDASLGEATGLVFGQDARADRNVQPGLFVDERDQVEDALQRALVGPAYGEDDAELGGAEGGGLAAAVRTSSGSRKGVAFTGVSKREDCEQKWQSSGQPPVLAERMPSISTSGPHQARRT